MLNVDIQNIFSSEDKSEDKIDNNVSIVIEGQIARFVSPGDKVSLSYQWLDKIGDIICEDRSRRYKLNGNWGKFRWGEISRSIAGFLAEHNIPVPRK